MPRKTSRMKQKILGEGGIIKGFLRLLRLCNLWGDEADERQEQQAVSSCRCTTPSLSIQLVNLGDHGEFVFFPQHFLQI